MSYSDYNHGFAHGVTVRNVPINLTLATKANTFWVDSVNGNDAYLGTFTRPFKTLDFAIGKCTANHGDTIYVSAKHAETVVAASGITFDVAGVAVIFLGEGSDRGTITFSTLVTASIVISAANVTIKDARFVAGIDALTGPISITGANCRLSGEWYDAPAKAATDCIATAATADGLIIDGWKYYASTTGTQKNSQIKLLGVDNAVIKNVDIAGDFVVANINNLTTECLNIRLENIRLKNDNATPKPGIVIQANATGQAKNVDIRIASGTTYVSSVAKINWDNNCLGYNADGYSGDPIGTAPSGSLEAEILVIDGNTKKIDSATLAVSPTAGSLATFIASGGTALGTALATSKSIVDAIGSNGTTLVYGSGSALGAIGTEFWVKKTLTSSAITQAGVDVTAVSSGGALLIDQVILMTDASTGLAGGTNAQLNVNNVNGAALFAATAVSGLGAAATISTPSVTSKKVILESGKKVTMNATAADCTGAGTVDVYIKFQRLAAGATVAAA
jgi:hypothetical protein